MEIDAKYFDIACARIVRASRQTAHASTVLQRLVGRSPAYLARQMYDMKLGTRKRAMTALMMPVLANLTDADIVDLVAYLSSREP